MGLAKRTLKNDLIDVCNICSFNCKDNSQVLLGRAIQGQQSQIGKLNLGSRKTNFHQQRGMALEQVANETVEISSLEAFRSWLERGTADLI